MPGFFVSNCEVDIELKNQHSELCIQDELSVAGLTVKRNTLNKFLDDKTLTETDLYITVLDGYILNKKSLFEKYNVASVSDLMIKMYDEKGDEFFADFRGGFSGAFYDKKCNKWLVFTNHTGDNPVFYAKNNGKFFAGCQVDYILAACNSAGFELNFDESAAYQLLTFAFMANDATFAKEIKRLRGGTYLCACQGEISVKTYHTFKKHPERFENYTESQLIDELDKAFRAAVKLEFDKDAEYGYTHLSDISGGLDSRMTVWVAHEMGCSPMKLLTYSRANYLDELIAKQIAFYWKDELFVRPLDDAAFFYDVDEIVALNGGTSIYISITGGNRILKSLDLRNCGLEHTGMVGDVIIGSWYHNASDAQRNRPSGKYSEKLAHRLDSEVMNYRNEFDDHEIYLNYTRGIHGAANTYLIRKNYTEVSSPFLNTDFLELCLDLPIQYRMNHNIYKKWILTKYPEAAKFKWEKINAKITQPKIIEKIRHIATRGPKKLMRMIGLDHLVTNGMTAFDYWVKKDENIRNFMDDYMRKSIENLPVTMSEQLMTDIEYLYTKGTVREQTMVLTLMSAIKLYFGNDNI